MKHFGIALPLFALHSEKTPGKGGTFYDLLPLIDWCKDLGIDFIQLLPLNDSGKDLSPYNILSSCALHPRYLFPEEHPKKGAEYDTFVKENPWLKTYPGDPWIQYLCYMQMKKVKQYANGKGISLVGDLPILMAKESADVKAWPELFDLKYSAGAPPDQYSDEGQYWGFPIYNWENHRKTDFAWWKQRLNYASNFYNVYRIDHVVGLFRIWAIPFNKKASEGKFLPENPSKWVPQGQEILKMMLSSCKMFPIAEDLGTVPLEVRACLSEMGIAGTKVMRWERYWQTTKEYIPPDLYPPLSQTCVSTHDSETLTLWWKNQHEEAELYAKTKGWQYTPDLSLEQRKEILKESCHTSSLFHCNLLQEYLALFPELTWPDPNQERINIPGTLLSSNWNYRFRPTLEQILSHKGLKQELRTLFFS